jgi:hypothetical protein
VPRNCGLEMLGKRVIEIPWGFVAAKLAAVKKLAKNKLARTRRYFLTTTHLQWKSFEQKKFF